VDRAPRVLVLAPVNGVHDAVIAALRAAEPPFELTITDVCAIQEHFVRDFAFDIAIADTHILESAASIAGGLKTGPIGAVPLLLMCEVDCQLQAAQAIEQGLARQYLVASPDTLRALPAVVRQVVQHARIQVEQDATQERLDRVVHARKTMAECNHVLVRETRESLLLQAMCDIVVAHGQYRGAWIGLANDPGGVITPVAQAGSAHVLPATANVGGVTGEYVSTAANIALTSGQHYIVRDPTQPDGPAAACFPLIAQDGTTFGALTILADTPGAFGREDIEMLDELANDVAYGMHTLRARENHQRVLEGLSRSEARFVQLAAHIREIFYLTDVGISEIIYISPAYEEIWGRSCESVYANPASWMEAVHPHDRSRVEKMVEQGRSSGSYDDEYRVVRPDGTERWVRVRGMPVRDHDGKIYRIAGVAEDITERKEQESRLAFLAYHDGLTKLPNRALLNDRIEQMIMRSRRDGGSFIVMFIDLDRFKDVNDSVSHEAGDMVLMQTAARLIEATRAGDTVARHGGDEYVVAAPSVDTAHQAAELAQRIVDEVAAPLHIGEQEVFVGASIGIAFYPKDGETVSELLRNADAAMYMAKKAGRGCYRFYDSAMNARPRPRLKMEAALRRALDRNEFTVYYQPEIDVATGCRMGFEALVRWMHPKEGLLSPGTFIGLAEETGLILPLGEWVLREACRQAKQWLDDGNAEHFVAVNLSARQFRDLDLVKLVESVLVDSGLAPQCLELELTESMVMDDPEQSARVVCALRALGVRISLDDFGTGYSSLAYLKRFAVDKLKIDRSFVADITSDADAAAIATAIIAMAHRLRLQVVAEGVETDAQFGYLRQHHCNFAQGYLFSQPLPPHECALRSGSSVDLPVMGSAANTLLVVDDESSVLAAIRRTFRKEGYTLLTASCAAEAFEVMARQPVGVVLCDQRMPVMNGGEFLSRVSELYPDSVRIMLSGYTDLETVTQAVNRGAIFKFLTKPWEDDGLRSNIAEAFRWYRLCQPG